MELITPTPILEFHENQLQTVRKALGYEDVNKLKEDREHMYGWTKKQNHFIVKEMDPTIADGFIERFLIMNKGSLERAKQKLEMFCTYGNLMPEFLQNFDPINEFHRVHKITNNYVLPKPTTDNYRVLVTSMTGVDDKEFVLIEYLRYMITIGHYLLNYDYCLGFEWISDSRKIPINIVMSLNPVLLHKYLMLCMGAIGIRIKRLHFLSGSVFFDTVLMVIKQGLSPKLKERILVHNNVESLYKYFPKENLPKELGGDTLTASELSEATARELSSEEHIKILKFTETLRTDESKRLPAKFNEEYSGMAGSFKSLCVD